MRFTTNYTSSISLTDVGTYSGTLHNLCILADDVVKEMETYIIRFFQITTARISVTGKKQITHYIQSSENIW